MLPRKWEPWFVFSSFFLLRFFLHLYKSIIQPCMEYCRHVWVGTPSCYLELLSKLQKRIYRTLVIHLLPLVTLAHRRNVASLSFFYRYYFGRYSSELAQLVPLPYSRGRSTCYFLIFLSSFLDVKRMSTPIGSFLAQLDWNSLPIEWFSLTHDFSGFKSRINRRLLTVGSF